MSLADVIDEAGDRIEAEAAIGTDSERDRAAALLLASILSACAELLREGRGDEVREVLDGAGALLLELGDG